MAMWMVAENMAGNPLLGEMLAEAFETEGSPQREMEQAIERSIRAGEIRPVDPKQLMLTIVSGCVFFFVALPTVKMMNPVARDDFETFVQQRKAHLFEVIYHGLVNHEVSNA
jgi:TetR/AcrR family transcriptional regulator